MTASDTSPTEGHECDGASDVEQRVLRELVETNTQLAADQLRESRHDDLDEQLEQIREARAELSIIETLLAQYVDEPQDDENDE